MAEAGYNEEKLQTTEDGDTDKYTEPTYDERGILASMIGYLVPTQDDNTLPSHPEDCLSRRKSSKNPCSALRCHHANMTTQHTQWITCRHMRGIYICKPNLTPYGAKLSQLPCRV